MRKRLHISISGAMTALGLLLTACASVAPTAGAPAVLTNASPDVTASLEEQISVLLNGRKITLAPDVLTTTPVLILDPRPLISLSSPNPLTGRAQSRPNHFYLSRNASKCVLTHKESGRSVYLKHAKCRVVK